MKSPPSTSSTKSSKKHPSPLPYNFVFDYLLPEEPVVKPMFGCHALYLGKKIVFILRKRSVHKNINGVWIASLLPSTPRLVARFAICS